MKGDIQSKSASNRPSRMTRRPKRNRRWECLLGPYEAGDFQIVPLTTSDDLRVDGYVMNHCVGRYYPTWCKQGFIRIFSIRDLLGQRLATLSLVFDYDQDRWRLEQCRGFGNREVCFKALEPSDLHFLVEDIVTLYQRAHQNSGNCHP